MGEELPGRGTLNSRKSHNTAERSDANALRGLHAVVRGEMSTMLGLLSRQGMILSGEAGRRIYGCCKPDGHGLCDHNNFERGANILTSIPYNVIGFQTLRRRKTAEGRLYGGALMGVGAGSLIYHTSHGRWRNLGRKLDYWCIALASTALLRAARPETGASVLGAALFMTPFQPFVVTVCNGAVVEWDYLKRAKAGPARLRRTHSAHLWTSVVGSALFALEEVAPRIPLIHTAWHVLSSYGVATTNGLLEDLEGGRDSGLPDS